MNPTPVGGIEMTAGIARRLVEAEERPPVEGEHHAAKPDAMRAVGAQRRVVHVDLDDEVAPAGGAGKAKPRHLAVTGFELASTSKETKRFWQTWQRPTLPSLET